MTRYRVELQVVGVDPDVDALELAELAELGAGEGRLRGAPATDHDNLLQAALPECVERVVGDVGALELAFAQGEDARQVGRNVAIADDDGPLGRQVEVELAVVRVAVVPSHELGRRPAAGQFLAGDAERLVGLSPGRVDDGRVVLHQLGV